MVVDPRPVVAAIGAAVIVASCATGTTDRLTDATTATITTSAPATEHATATTSAPATEHVPTTDADAELSSIAGGSLLVWQLVGDDRRLVAIDVGFDPDGSAAERPFELPEPCAVGAPCDPRFVVSDGESGRAVIGTEDHVFWVDAASGATRYAATAAHVRVTPPTDPRYVVASASSDGAGPTAVLDIAAGTTTEITLAHPLQHVAELRGGILITTLGGPATIVDTTSGPATSGPATSGPATSGPVTELGPDLLVGPHSVDRTGERLVAVDTADRGRHLAIVDLSDPTEPERWFTSSNGFGAGWVDDRVVVVEPVDGLVSIVDAAGSTELARLAPGETVASTLLTDPEGTSALVGIRSDPVRWYRIDVETGQVEELDELVGMDIAPISIASASHTVLSDHDGGSEITRVAAVPIRSGPIIPVLSTVEPAFFSATTIGDDHLYVRTLSGPGELNEAWIVDLTTAEATPTAVGGNATATADGSHFALTVGTGAERSVVVIPVDQPSVPVEVAAGWVVGWLPS